MHILARIQRRGACRVDRRRRGGFSLLETCVGMAVVGVTFSALYSGMTFGIGNVQRARETLRATQVMAEKLDTIRLYTYDKIATPGYVPGTFTAPFAPVVSGLSALGVTNTGFTYHGTVTIDTNLSGVSGTYKKDLLQVTVDLAWTNQGAPRAASMSTFVARNGLQTYVY
jgi:type II secretory pathway pseudopilin PulG